LEKSLEHLAAIVSCLTAIEKESGKLIHLDLEPEPDGWLESSKDVVEFFTGPLLKVADILSNTEAEDNAFWQEKIRRHIRICYDVCHAAVMFEDPENFVQALEKERILIGKMQISSALKFHVAKSKNPLKLQEEKLLSLTNSPYLHQIRAKTPGEMRGHSDLLPALAHMKESAGQEWRIHFHVPIFIEQYEFFSSTQDTLKKSMELFMKRPFTNHLEIETYTWEILPKPLKLELSESIVREYQWVLEHIN